MAQLDLFDTTPTQTAINKSYENAPIQWIVRAEMIIRQLAVNGQSFSSDDCWRELEQHGLTVREPRALGAIMLRLARAGVIRSTGQYVKSVRKEAHRRPICVWQGL